MSTPLFAITIWADFSPAEPLIRDFDVRGKLNLIKEAVEGKRVVVVDDSIVPGDYRPGARREPARSGRERSA